MTKLRDEFNFLVKRYNLNDIGYFAFHVKSAPTYFSDPNCQGLYLPTFKAVVMKGGHRRPLTLKCMLHELCHAKQHQENRLLVPVRHYKKLYALEIEAELFALFEYKKLYADKFGSLENWGLAGFTDYKRHFQNQPMNSISPMSWWELYSFVLGLKGCEKKPILRYVREHIRQCETRSYFEELLSRICI